MRLAFFGDVVGRSGREGLATHLPGLRRRCWWRCGLQLGGVWPRWISVEQWAGPLKAATRRCAVDSVQP